MSEKIDYLIVGQGLAGTLVADRLLEQNKKVIVVDAGHHEAASKIASGIMNPITGRRFVKSWMYDDLLPVAIARYQSLEKKLSSPLLFRRNIVRELPNQAARTDWLLRGGDPMYRQYIVAGDRYHSLPDGLHSMLERMETCGSYQLDIPNLILRYRLFLEEKGILLPQRFRHDRLEVSTDQITYQGFYARGIIFCEGKGLTSNPLFGNHLLEPSIGERLEVRIHRLNLDFLLKKKFFLAPISHNNFWFGGATHWNFDDELPSQRAFLQLTKALRELIDLPYEILSHHAAIRPTVFDRRPILGAHPQHSNVFLFNGLGTKGASLGPFWVDVMVRFICNTGTIPSEVNLSRFLKI